MPTVSRSDCTQVDLTETIKISFDGSSVTGKLTSVHVDFNACRGINNRNNDLWAYMARLYYQGDITPTQFGEAGRIITNTGCEEATRYHLNEMELTRGYDHDISTWTKVAGRDDLHDGHPYGKETFNKAFFEGSLTKPTDLTVDVFPAGETPIIMRICATCTDTHKKIFYRRLTPITNPNFDLLNNILYHRSNGNGDNVWGVDFSLHSSYEEAVVGTNPWLCRNNAFNYGAPFDGECSPTGARTTNQYSIWNWYPGPRSDVAYYVNKPELEGIQELDLTSSLRFSNVQTDVDLGRVGIPGRTLEGVDGALHISGSGNDIYGQADTGHYFSEPQMGDVDVKVHISAFTGIVNSYAKAGIMLRADNDDDATHIFAMLSGAAGITLTWRTSKHNGSSHSGWYKTSPVQTSAWLRLVKKMDMVEFYRSDDGINWILHSTKDIRFPNDTFRVGLAVTSHNNAAVSEAVFEDYTIDEYTFPTSAPSLSLAPTPWNPSVEVGGARPGFFSLDANSGISTFRGYGTGLWATNDSFFFQNVQKDSDGAFDVVTYINSFHTGYTSAKGGIMIRDSNDPDAAHAFIGMSGYYTGATFLSRASTGAKTDHHQTIFVQSHKAWVKLSKPANSAVNSAVITASYKILADDDWIEIGSTPISFTGQSLQVGTAVTTGDPNGNGWVDLKTEEFQIVDNPVRRKTLRA